MLTRVLLELRDKTHPNKQTKSLITNSQIIYKIIKLETRHQKAILSIYLHSITIIYTALLLGMYTNNAYNTMRNHKILIIIT